MGKTGFGRLRVIGWDSDSQLEIPVWHLVNKRREMVYKQQ